MDKDKLILNGEELISINTHQFQLGGGDGDGYCYAHQSFDCLESLSVEEKDILRKA